ncbi:maleylpyruvate isomerase N-terminal domain-containing protein [Umezawaea tangerina]|uniref:Uncharacterized protein (TIGR03083 family) n=1 Tax=Umezawaea tangerina TaxID=84725 RepID=A0A2T0TAL1_9PSEU|nr:maleylpyruvate isomerase N-terminal domain-containing protein [Umezawaea tangerina]PRY42696.1 uncharacterized protein (TIGR03083 family) [Umezawaea tangerina]
MDTTDLRAAASECATHLGALVAADWTTPIPDMEWTVAQAVAHVCDTVLWYATDFAAGPTELSTMDLAVRPSTPPSDLVRTLTTFTEVLARTVDGSRPGDRGWHDAGSPDASGVIAMATDELLIHTADAATGLATPFTPSPALASKVLARLFPEAPPGHAPWATLLWANGRQALGDVPRRGKWQWHCAPLTVDV